MAILNVGMLGEENVAVAVERRFSAPQMAHLNREVAFAVQERTADHIARASVSRHRTADRLGAEHTRFLEFAPARVRSFSKYTGGGPRPTIETRNVDEHGCEIHVINTPGMERAFRDLDIHAKTGGALTIPIHRDAYGYKVKDLRDMGRVIFHPKGSRILAEDDGAGGIRPLYLLVKSVRVKQDRGLMPLSRSVASWAADTVEAYADLL